MADYINQNILSQAYIHIESMVASDESKLDEFHTEILKFTRSRVDFFLSPEATITVDYEEGSLIARITVLGTVSLLLQGVANYKNFREGIQLIYSDTKRVTDYVISESIFAAGSRQQNVIRLEARVGVIGSVQKVINQLDGIKKGANGTKTANDLSEKLLKVKNDIDKLIKNLTCESDKKLIKCGLTEIVDELPDIPTPPKGKINDQAAINSYRHQKQKLRIRLSSS
ncbi:hypothetical protein [Pseudoalteromonas gelatinilytica]